MAPPKWADNPFVALVPERLRAAMADGGWDDARLARRITEDPALAHAIERQNIRHLATHAAKETRCRAERRAALAIALDVPDAWLGGDDVWLPMMPQLQLSQVARQSPRVALALQRFLVDCERRVRVDLAKTGYLESEDAHDVDPGAQAVSVLLHALIRLVTPDAWRGRLDTLSRGPRREPPEAGGERAEFETAALGLLAGWRSILNPWLSGATPLRYAALGDLVRWLLPNFAMEPTAPAPAGVATNVVRRRRIVRNPQHPLAFLLWPLGDEPTPPTEG